MGELDRTSVTGDHHKMVHGLPIHVVAGFRLFDPVFLQPDDTRFRCDGKLAVGVALQRVGQNGVSSSVGVRRPHPRYDVTALCTSGCDVTALCISGYDVTALCTSGYDVTTLCTSCHNLSPSWIQRSHALRFNNIDTKIQKCPSSKMSPRR